MSTKADLHGIAIHIANISSCDLIPKSDAHFYAFNIFSSSSFLVQCLKLAVKLTDILLHCKGASVYILGLFVRNGITETVKKLLPCAVAEVCRNVHVKRGGGMHHWSVIAATEETMTI